jgi:DNA polymerase-1
VGDPSDNIVGVSGVGPRTAAKLVNRFGSIETLLELSDHVAPARLRESLRAAAQQLRLNEDIARLRVNVPLGPGPRWVPVTADAVERLRQLFDELEFKSLLRRLDALEIRQ